VGANIYIYNETTTPVLVTLQKNNVSRGRTFLGSWYFSQNITMQMKQKKQYTLSDKIAERLDLVARLYDKPPEELIDEAVEAMYAATYKSYSKPIRDEMTREALSK
jgi:predicted transcriptional regulator